MADPKNDAYEKIWDNAAALANLLDATRENPDARPSQLWNLQSIWNNCVYDDSPCAPDRMDFKTISNMAWLVHPDRMEDLDRTTLNAFRYSCMRRKPFEDNDLLAHLPLHELEDLRNIMQRESRISESGLRVATPDQLAAVFHLSRLGASFRACQTFFTAPLCNHTVNACRSMTQQSFGPVNRPGWDWP